MWKIPETPELLQQRREVGVDRWPHEGNETVGTLPKALAADLGI